MAGERILAVDDSATVLEMIKSVLVAEGYEVLTAADGAEGLDVARAERPDLILLDVMMPALDGYEACRRLKADAATAEIPVIMLTAKTQAAEQKAGHEAGAVGYINKPFTPKDLVAQVREFLGE